MTLSWPTGRRARVAALAGVAAAQLLAFALVYLVTVRTVTGRRFGDASLRGALSTSPWVDGTVTSVLNVVSVASLLGAVAMVAVVALLRLARLRGLLAVGILLASNVSTLVLKDYLLPRPDLGLAEVAPATLNSLPSGHSTAAFSAVAALIFVLPGRWRLVVVLVGTAYAAVTGVATLSAGWHRAGDSVAAFLLVGFWTAVAAAVVVARQSSAPPADPELLPGRARWLILAAAGCLLVGVAFAAMVGVSGSFSDSSVGAWFAFLAGALLIVGAALAVALTLVRVVMAMDARPAASAVVEGT